MYLIQMNKSNGYIYTQTWSVQTTHQKLAQKIGSRAVPGQVPACSERASARNDQTDVDHYHLTWITIIWLINKHWWLLKMSVVPHKGRKFQKLQTYIGEVGCCESRMAEIIHHGLSHSWPWCRKSLPRMRMRSCRSWCNTSKLNSLQMIRHESTSMRRFTWGISCGSTFPWLFLTGI